MAFSVLVTQGAIARTVLAAILEVRLQGALVVIVEASGSVLELVPLFALATLILAGLTDSPIAFVAWEDLLFAEALGLYHHSRSKRQSIYSMDLSISNETK
ncbi:hypothetical protein CTheo_7202 [Ceratobasidium theobromae]|uniref:Uncharacterized protein n=1 Tax=Ceratobasidium theobromae TaxID=1582974 RepID=A0A5N5QCG6_9AGAM|nr:hypothetical protein CTheo_7202 [Ceratobasidium theobromae]